MANSEALLFVVGLWRSGTSLVHALLNQHPRVRLMYEAEPFGLWPLNPRSVWPADWPQRQEFYNQTISRHQLNVADLEAGAPAREAALAMYREFGKARGAAVIGEKAPAYHACLPGIARVFPEARFLIIWRDPLECCRSAARAGRRNRFFSKPGTMRRMLFGAEALARGVIQLQRQRMQVHEIVYSEFIGEPERHLRAICDFTQIPFDVRMLDLKGADVSALPAGDHHDPVRSGIIAAAEPEDDPLPAAFSAKGRRYAALWRHQFEQLGLHRALQVEPQQPSPGLGEQWCDQTAEAAQRAVEAIRRVVLRRIPLTWWARFRSSGPIGSKARVAQ